MWTRGGRPRGRESVPVRSPWRWLRQLRKERGVEGMIPMIGSGFNAQAVGTAFGWRDLLAEIRKQMGLSFKLPSPEQTTGNTTLIWERMLFDLAFQGQRHPHEVEARLQRVVSRTLRKAYPPGGVTSTFARRFLGLGFRDVLSFNFDQGLQDEDATWYVTGKELDPVTAHCRVVTGARVWYPHGSVKEPDSIQLGLRAYGMLIRKLETARQGYKLSEQELFGERSGGNSQPRTMESCWKVWGQMRDLAQSWVGTAMNAPLIFAGLSLGREEWPLWWFLNQRARNHARRNLSWEIPTFAILIRKEADALATAASLVNITLLPVDSYREGWERLFDALG